MEEIFERGGQTRRAATPAQAVKLKHDGWRPVKKPSRVKASRARQEKKAETTEPMAEPTEQMTDAVETAETTEDDES